MLIAAATGGDGRYTTSWSPWSPTWSDSGFLRRLRLHRFTPAETADLLRLVLGGDVDPLSGATVHGQAEGVPFIVEELAKAYREAGMIRAVDGVWTLAKNAGRLVPSAVQTLIQPARGAAAGRDDGAPRRRGRSSAAASASRTCAP